MSASVFASLKSKKDTKGARRATNYTILEDLMTCKAYIAASEGSAEKGAKQKAPDFNLKIEKAYLELCEEQEQLEARQRTSNARMGLGVKNSDEAQIVRVQYPRRTGSSVHQRCKKTIFPRVIKFMGVANAYTRQDDTPKPQSGGDVEIWFNKMNTLYKTQYGESFQFSECYEFLRDKPKFLKFRDAYEKSPTSTTKKPKSGDKRTSANRPMGSKAAKEQKKDTEFIDATLKRHGLVGTADSTKNEADLTKTFSSLVDVFQHGFDSWRQDNTAQSLPTPERKMYFSTSARLHQAQIENKALRLEKENMEMRAALASSNKTHFDKDDIGGEEEEIEEVFCDKDSDDEDKSYNNDDEGNDEPDVEECFILDENSVVLM